MKKNIYGNREKEILAFLDDQRKKDYTFRSGRILGSMCTQPHPIAKKAYMKFLETNLGDPELFPGTRELELKLTRFISSLLHAPKESDGIITSGGTEGNINAIWIAKRITGKNRVIIPETAHFSFQKISSLMDVKLKTIPLDSEYQMDIKELRKNIDDKTAAVVGIAGTTELGTVDPIPVLSEICSEENLFLHIDAAFGGFVIPFMKQIGYEIPDFDFKLPGVSTVSVDSHKMGCSAIPLGTLIVRNREWLNEISVESYCVSSKKQAGIVGTRTGGPVAAAYAVTKYLGTKGYMKMVKKCMDNTTYLQKKIEEIGLKPLVKPTLNVIGIKLKNPELVQRKLSEKKWKVNIMERISCIRIVLMPHVKKTMIDKFIPDLQKTCEEAGEI